MQRSERQVTRRASLELNQWVRELLHTHMEAGLPLPSNRKIASISRQWARSTIRDAIRRVCETDGLVLSPDKRKRFVKRPEEAAEPNELYAPPAVCAVCCNGIHHVSALYPMQSGGMICSRCLAPVVANILQYRETDSLLTVAPLHRSTVFAVAHRRAA